VFTSAPPPMTVTEHEVVPEKQVAGHGVA
jgi:hypothetical protein